MFYKRYINQDRFPEVDDVEGLAAGFTKIIEKWQYGTLDLFHFIWPSQDSYVYEFYIYSDPKENKPYKFSLKMEKN